MEDIFGDEQHLVEGLVDHTYDDYFEDCSAKGKKNTSVNEEGESKNVQELDTICNEEEDFEDDEEIEERVSARDLFKNDPNIPVKEIDMNFSDRINFRKNLLNVKDFAVKFGRAINVDVTRVRKSIWSKEAYEKGWCFALYVIKLVHGFFAVGQFTVGQFVLKKNVSFG